MMRCTGMRLVVVFLLAAWLLVPLAAHADEPSANAATHDAVRGSFSTRLNVETAGGESDWRTDEYLRLEIQPEYAPHLTIRGAVWSWQDLDGHEPETSSLRGLGDTYDAAVQVRPLYLYVQGEDLWGASTLRVGRQRIEQSVSYSLVDGVYFNKRNDKWEWYAFLGTRGTLYEESFQDPSAGAGVAVRPTSYTRIALDTFYTAEGRDRVRRPFYADWFSLRYPVAIPDDVDTRQLALSLRQRIGEQHQFYARYVINAGESDEIRAALTGTFGKRRVAYDLSYVQRLNTVTDRGSDAGSFYRVLGALDRYRDVSAAVHVPFGEHFALSVEGQLHDASGDDYNRDYGRYGLYLSAAKLWRESLDFRAGVSRWDVENGEGTWALTGEATKHWAKAAFTLGTDYAVYQDRIEVYNANPYRLSRAVVAFFPGLFPGFYPLARLTDVRTVETEEDIYSIYGKFAYELNKQQSLWLKATYQIDDGPDSPYWRAQAEYTIRF